MPLAVLLAEFPSERRQHMLGSVAVLEAGEDNQALRRIGVRRHPRIIPRNRRGRRISLLRARRRNAAQSPDNGLCMGRSATPQSCADLRNARQPDVRLSLLHPRIFGTLERAHVAYAHA
jgi:hypothetical protein